MTITQLIAELQNIRDREGDVNVKIWVTTYGDSDLYDMTSREIRVDQDAGEKYLVIN